jgi:hypothetical protein
MATKKSELPPGWDDAKIKDLVDYYESQTDEEAAEEHGAALSRPDHTLLEIPTESMFATRASEKSSLRERLVEHIFVGDLMRTLWLYCPGADLEVLRPETDCGGYDLVLEFGSVVRHVQLKSSARGARTKQQTVQLGLGLRPSGCVLWVMFEPSTIELGPYLWFGNKARQPLPDISNFKRAKHARGDAKGVKRERPNVRVIERWRFDQLTSIRDVANRLFDLDLEPVAHGKVV